MPRTVDSVRQVTIDEHWGDLSPESETEQLRLAPPDPSTVEVMVDDYPFPDQTIFEGNFRYERGRVGTDVATGTYQIRSGSGLLILRKESGRIHPDDVATAISDEVDGDIEIHDSIILNREGLWIFIDSADTKMEIEVLTPIGEVRGLDELQEEEELSYEDVFGDYPVNHARIFFSPNDGESIEVVYANDTLSIGSSSDNAHEYVIQLFERDVIGG
jgi:hypothetical protein